VRSDDSLATWQQELAADESLWRDLVLSEEILSVVIRFAMDRPTVSGWRGESSGENARVDGRSSSGNDAGPHRQRHVGGGRATGVSDLQATRFSETIGSCLRSGQIPPRRFEPEIDPGERTTRCGQGSYEGGCQRLESLAPPGEYELIIRGEVATGERVYRFPFRVVAANEKT
jgi:hypothetical protein